jgi:hypothetical protein
LCCLKEFTLHFGDFIMAIDPGIAERIERIILSIELELDGEALDPSKSHLGDNSQ